MIVGLFVVLWIVEFPYAESYMCSSRVTARFMQPLRKLIARLCAPKRALYGSLTNEVGRNDYWDHKREEVASSPLFPIIQMLTHIAKEMVSQGRKNIFRSISQTS